MNLIELEVGRELSFDPSTNLPADALIVLEVEDLVVPPVVRHASLMCAAGEIVCLAGLGGSRMQRVMRSHLWNIAARSGGHIRVKWHGDRYLLHLSDAMQMSIGMVPEDRRDSGLFLAMSIVAQISRLLTCRVSHRVVSLKPGSKDKLANQYRIRYAFPHPVSNREVMFLSGGNQQKVLLACWLARQTENSDCG